MIRQEYVEEIKKILLSAKIEKIYNADLVVEDKDSSDLLFPEFDKIFDYVNNGSNSDKFFERVFLTLSNYQKYVTKKNFAKFKVTIEPLLKRVDISEKTIAKLLKETKSSVVFDALSEHIIEKKVSLVFNEEYSDSLNFLYDLLDKLANKVKNYIVRNAIYNNAYRVQFSENIKKFKNEDPLLVISNITEETKKIVDKKYIPDFLSDGKEDLEEMMKCFWGGLSCLLYYSKPSENVSYVVDGKDTANVKEWLKKELDAHYAPLASFLNGPSFLVDFTDVEVRDVYEKLEKVKIPKEINPRTEADLSSKKGKAEQKLAELIGLNSVKDMIDKIKAYTSANKGKSDLNLHMAFYGNPGTGKTEVAKLIGEILFENGVLPKKTYVEATRSDLVGAYIGHTAIKTQELIKKAMGGVLFIDEAYSLSVDGDSQDYGNEAIAELIKEMEDNKGKFCVILAGYKNKMQKMLATNPGFNSRIQFHLDFKNYSRDELSEIFKLMLDHDGYIATEDALNKMLDITDVLRKDPDFANARSARNILQQCLMCLSLRTGDPNDKTITIEDVDKYIKDSKIIPSSSSSSSGKILSGEEQLERLIGLNSVKTNIKKIRAYAKKNKDTPNLNLHMAFTGNPGTGKSEVAHIISRVLFEAGVLPEAKVIVGNRETLVGRYVGETAIKTKEAVQKAMGGVLFIDEAYALASDSGSQHDFGAEAIATLIDEMENNKGKFCVVVAGYEKPLKNMIATNPGFGSRIQFYIDFPDYSREELEQIALSFLSKESVPYSITNEAMEAMLDICDFYRTQDDFANARTIRKMLQDIIMNQNLRVEDELDNNEIILDDVNQYAEDNHLVKVEKKKTKNLSGLDSQVIECLNKASLDYDAAKIDNLYYEQAVVSISGDGAQGTGFIISPNGICLTCAHCLHGDGSTQKARIVLALADGQKFKNYVGFDVLYVDEENDFAVLKLEETGMSYRYMPLTMEKDSKYDSLQEFIMAGYPFGGESFSSISITEGKIASVNNIGNRTVVFADMFGKPGNSGSPVIDKTTKKVIGIFWGGIAEPKTHETINCFTPSNIIWKSIKN